LYDIGTAAAAKQVDTAHFPDSFKI